LIYVKGGTKVTVNARYALEKLHSQEHDTTRVVLPSAREG
jgi:hypothetical protein